MTSPSDLLKGTTKGPWKVICDADEEGWIEISPVHAFLWNSEDSDLQNAHLIAAAPDLAKRLEEAEELLHEFFVTRDMWDYNHLMPQQINWSRRAEAFLNRSSQEREG